MKNIKNYLVTKSFAEFTEGQIVTNETLRVRRKANEDPKVFKEVTDEEIKGMKAKKVELEKAKVDKQREEAKSGKKGSPSNKTLDIPDNKDGGK